jgi:16S rRNA (guanine527-N7)-methyltransferase
MDRARLLKELARGIAALEPDLDAAVTAQLADYIGLLARWNEAYNLTAVRQPKEMVTRHVMDSLSILPFVGDGRLLDVGTGAGLPGLVIAMACPGLPVVLLDSSGKKTRFVEHAVRRLGLANVRVVRARVETWRDEQGFGAVVSRAFASLGDFLGLAGHLLAHDGRMLAMKGELPEDELAALPDGWRLLGAHRLRVPGLEARRHLVEFGREDTP